jgi:hypothetical protein
MDIRQVQLTVRETAQETSAERIRRLQDEARQIVNSEVADLEQLLRRAVELAGSIVQAGDACSPGVREICRSIADDLGRTAQTFAGIARRTGVLPFQ